MQQMRRRRAHGRAGARRRGVMITPDQQVALDAIRRLNSSEFSDWFDTSEVMAFCQVESAFRPKAYRYEPRIGEGSYGLMQVLATTARDVAGIVDAESMYQVEIGLRAGMTVAKKYWELLAARLHRDPTLDEWSASYNEGVGGELRDEADGTIDIAYPRIWEAAHQHWAAVLANVAPATPTIRTMHRDVGSAAPTALAIQTALRDAGYDLGPLDGIWGPRSQAAFDAWRHSL